ncbi:MAG: sulfur carrier protein [Flavobacteriales bacterium]|jgi:sulfur carrier protein
MQLVINGKKHSTYSKKLHEILNELKLTNNNFAIAVNEVFIPKNKYTTLTLNENDQIEVLSPMQGG